jgi:hypothetical protein
MLRNQPSRRKPEYVTLAYRYGDPNTIFIFIWKIKLKSLSKKTENRKLTLQHKGSRLERTKATNLPGAGIAVPHAQ